MCYRCAPIPPVVDGGGIFVFDMAGNLHVTIPSPGGLATATRDRFGSSIAITQNGWTVAGAPMDTLDLDGPGGAEPLVEAGSVYVLNKSGKLLMAIPNPEPGNGDSFGASVAVDRFGNVLVGAPSDDDVVGNSGSAYLFDRHGTLLQKVHNPTPSGGDQFGASVVFGGSGELVVGAPVDDQPVDNSGVVHVFDREGGLIHTIENPFPESSDRFGAALAVDPVGHVIVGAEQDADPDGAGPMASIPESGAVFAFDTTWTLQLTLVDPDRDVAIDPDDPGSGPRGWVTRLGRSVAALEGRILAGAPQQRTADGMVTGAVLVFDGSTGVLLDLLENPFPGEGDSFGRRIAVGYAGEDAERPIVAVGAPLDDDADGAGPAPAIVDGGAAFLLDLEAGTLLRTISNPAPAAADLFGDWVALGQDDDGGALLAVGAPFDDDPDGTDGPVGEAVDAGSVFIVGVDELNLP